jgi:site-specific DNA recombinase
MTTLPQTPERAVLYARVSTDEQAKKGYSIGGQLDELRTVVEAQGYEIVAEIKDEGYGRETLERPGIDELYDLAESGSVDAVWAWQRDRYGASPCPEVLSIYLDGYGVALRALDDVGEGEDAYLLHGLKDLMAKREIRNTVRRSRMGKLEKARQGKVIGGTKIPYGFSMNEAGDAYVLDEEKMTIVRRIFQMVADKANLYAVQQSLMADGVPAPAGGRSWSRTTLRNIILDDCYFPFTHNEVAALVAPEVAGRLNESLNYGIWWYNKTRTKATRVVRMRDGSYVKRRTYAPNPKDEWVAVPVIDAGVEREMAERARQAIRYNRPSKTTNRRFWELSGGLLYCGECGRRMGGHNITSGRHGRKTRRFYYICTRRYQDNYAACPNRHHRAEDLERRVQESVTKLFRSEEQVERLVEERMERERKRDLRKETEAWAKRLDEITAKRGRYQDQQAAGLMTIPELEERLGRLEEEQETAQRELEALRSRQEHIEHLNNEAAVVLALYAAYAGVDLGLFPPEERRRLYEALGLRVTVDAEGKVEIEVHPGRGGPLPAVEEAWEMVAHTISGRERDKAYQEKLASMDAKLRRAGLEHVIPEGRRNVMPEETSRR